MIVFRSARGGALAAALLAGLVAWLLLDAGGARAQAGGEYDPDPGAPGQTAEIAVTTGPEGVTIHITVEQTTPGVGGTPGGEGPGTGPGGGSPPTCQASPVNAGYLSTGWIAEGLEQNPGSFPWAVSCSDGSFAIVWIPTDAGAPQVVVESAPLPPIDPEVVRRELFRIVPLPPIGIGVNPAVGLVALESWFWVEGYRGETITGSATLGPYDVDVEIAARRYSWIFGDGSSRRTTSPGLAYPARSDIRHTYARSSLAPGGSYRLSILIVWDARYRENGGEWLTLDPIGTSHGRPYTVRQLQSVLTTTR